MNPKIALVLLLTAALGTGACASAGGSGGNGGSSDPRDDWSGPTPSDNEYTTQANLYLVQSLRADDESQARAFARQALSAARQGTENAPQNPMVWFVAGRAYIAVEEYARADSMFDRARELYPYYEEIDAEREQAWVDAYNKGVEALQSGDNEQALTYFEGAAALWDGRPAAHLQVGSLAAQTGQPEKAIDAFQGALDIIRGPAVEEADTSVTAQWDDFERIATFNMGQLLAAEGRDDEAAQAYRTFSERFPDNLDARTNLAVVLSRQGKAAEAGRIYDELLQRPNLSSQNYLMAGIGLFQAERYEDAAAAFRRALDANPQSRDAVYNLAQAYYVQTTELETALDSTATTDAERQQIRGDLTSLYERLRDRLTQVREMDPYNSNVLALQARAFRGLADFSADSATSNQWRQRALQVLQEHEALPFTVANVSIGETGDQVTITGTVTNRSLDPGTPIRLQFELIDQSGASLATPTVTVAAPQQEQSSQFRGTAQVQADVAGWRYSVMN